MGVPSRRPEPVLLTRDDYLEDPSCVREVTLVTLCVIPEIYHCG